MVGAKTKTTTAAIVVMAVCLGVATAGDWCHPTGAHAPEVGDSGSYCRYGGAGGGWGVTTCECSTGGGGRRRRRDTRGSMECRVSSTPAKIDADGNAITGGGVQGTKCAGGCIYDGSGKEATGTDDGVGSLSGPERGRCGPSNAPKCGTTWDWVGKESDDTCPMDGQVLPVGYTSWESVMDNKGNEVVMAKVVATSDAAWFQLVLAEDLFTPTCGAYDAATCPWLGDPVVCTTDTSSATVASGDDYLVAQIRAFSDGAELGWVTVEKVGDDFQLTLTDWASGSALSGQTEQGVHIHTGTSCVSAAATAGHFYSGASDPWAASTYTSTGAGVVASKTVTVSGVGKTMLEVANHALVVHAGGVKVACGVLSPCGSVRTSAWDDATSGFVSELTACNGRAKCSVGGSGRADTMPAPLASIASAWAASKQYEAFSCTRNLPECAANAAVLANCETQCEAVNAAIGNFAVVCEAQRAAEAISGQGCTADGGATCVLTPAPSAWEDTSARCILIADGSRTAESVQAACDAESTTMWVASGAGFCSNTAGAGTCIYNPPSFRCYTLGTDPNPDTSCTGTADPTTGVTSWCNSARQRGLWGQSTCPAAEGCPATGMDQGWKRDCPALCREFQQNAPPAPSIDDEEEDSTLERNTNIFYVVLFIVCLGCIGICCKVLQMMGIVQSGEPEDEDGDIEMKANDENE